MSSRSEPLRLIPGDGRPTLRKDPRGYVIEDDAAAEGTLRSLEAAGLIFLELFLRRIAITYPHLETDVELALKGIGTLAGRVGMSRLAWLTGVDETGKRRADATDATDHQIAGEHMRGLLNWLLQWELDPDAPPSIRPPAPPPPSTVVGLLELHDAAIYLDRRARSQGTTGSGRRRTMTRDTTRTDSRSS